MSNTVGRKLAHCEIPEQLGAGGMGEAEDSKPCRQMALKVSNPNTGENLLYDNAAGLLRRIGGQIRRHRWK